MRSAYDKFGLNSQVTGSMDTALEETDNILVEQLNKSERDKRSQVVEVRHQLVLVCLELLVSLMLFRLSRTWNATGDKWRHLPDLGAEFRAMPEGGQQYVLIVSMALMFLSIKACPPVLLVALGYLYGSYYPYMATSTGGLELALVYVCAVCVLSYGLARNLFIRYVFVTCGHFTACSFTAFGVFGITNILDVGRLRRRSSLPTTSPSPRVGPDDFPELCRRHNSNHFLVSESLRYLHCSVAIAWLLLQRKDNLPLCCLLLLQDKLVSC